jgi:putative glutamine amidotransferase
MAVAALDGLDGLLLTGGGDVDPMLYHEPMKGSDLPSWPRDHLETAQYHRARARGLPIFGICRGLQFLNVAMGGSLVQDLPSADAHRDNAWKESRSHLVHVVGGTALARILGGDASAEDLVVGVNSYHHQGVSVARLAPGLVASSFSEAGGAAEDLVEGVETAGTRAGEEFVLGVQWHPERMADPAPVGHQPALSFAETSRRLFRAFVAAAEARASRNERARQVLLQV